MAHTARKPIALHKEGQLTSEELSRMSSDDFKDLVLYVAADDPNSAEATAALERSAHASDTLVVDVLGAQNLPTFVDGVPCLHNKRDGVVQRGSQAISFLSTASSGAILKM